MELLVFFGVIAGIVIVIKVVSWCVGFVQDARLAALFGDEIETLCNRLSPLSIDTMRNELDSARSSAAASMPRLASPDGKVLNVCPKCGGLLTARPSLNRLHLSCRKSGCSHSESIEAVEPT